jgi:hypothetical protein
MFALGVSAGNTTTPDVRGIGSGRPTVDEVDTDATHDGGDDGVRHGDRYPALSTSFGGATSVDIVTGGRPWPR